LRPRRDVSSHVIRPTVRMTRIQPAVSRLTKSHPTRLSAAISQSTATYREMMFLMIRPHHRPPSSEAADPQHKTRPPEMLLPGNRLAGLPER